MQRLLLKLSQLSATKQFFFVRTFYDWGIYLFDTFYMTYVFKESGDVRQVVYNILITLVTIFLGFILGSIFLSKVGVEKNLRLSFLLFIVTGLVGTYLAGIGQVSFLLISVIRGIAEGFYWASANLIELSGLPHASRSKFYSISTAVNGVFSIVIPISLGYLLLQMNSLLPSFALFSVVCLLAALFPFRFDISDKARLRRHKFRIILKHPKIVFFSINKIVLAAMWMLSWLLWSILPFVILGDEFGMGIFLTISSLLGVIIAYFTRSMTIEKKTKYAWPMFLLSAFAYALLLIDFSPAVLYFQSILLALTSSLVYPVEQDLAVRMSNVIDAENEKGVEMNLFNEVLYTSARLLIGAVVLLFIFSGADTEVTLRFIVVVFVLLQITNFLLSRRFLQLGKAR
ncbi:MAG: hypothetical protein QY312_02820 [Candidatus Dojkabacteria bacterium]|nr:MAG: hypothetical protein QY312_02820 [Candidatus Dojkabacteria bacterium]